MKPSRLVIPALAALAFAGCAGDTPPAMLEVSETVEVAADLDSVRSYAGDYCAIATWHEAVVGCETMEEDGDTYRILTLVDDGGQIKERQDSVGADGYSYTITEGPLPVKDYSASFRIEGDSDGAMVTWSASFHADGAEDAEAQELITSIFSGGLASISAHFAE